MIRWSVESMSLCGVRRCAIGKWQPWERLVVAGRCSMRWMNQRVAAAATAVVALAVCLAAKQDAIFDSWDDDDSSRELLAYSPAELSTSSACWRSSVDLCKQQYLAAYAGSCHPQHRCCRILPPRPPLSAPTPAVNTSPGLFSEHHANVLPYPPLSPRCLSAKPAVCLWRPLCPQH